MTQKDAPEFGGILFYSICPRLFNIDLTLLANFALLLVKLTILLVSFDYLLVNSKIKSNLR